MDLETKALLISVGTIHMDETRTSGQVSTAGPGAGGQSVFFQSGERMVRLSVATESPLRLERSQSDVAIFKGDREIARGQLVEPLLHCPEQAYITVSERCIYDCKFCAVPKLKGGVKSLETIREMIEKASGTGNLRAISLTSGVEISPEQEAKRVTQIARDLSSFGVPIGVSVSPFPGVNQMLKDANVNEVKYNLETVDRDLFQQVCPGISFQEIMDALQEAVGVFGKNKVFSNVIVGLGESDETLREGIDELTEMGVLPVLRAAFPHPLRVGDVKIVRPSAERLLGLARYLKNALDRNDLAGNLALTGCYRCTGCDLAPGQDL
jgi:biotin synthase-related radical SAM superfamily protein